VAARRVRNAFVCSRPPGHHARNSGREEGFCFFNHVAIGARHAQRRHGWRRVLIADWDYHHGDGTESLFYDDPTVLVFSTHDVNAYPRTGFASRTGSGAGDGFNINVPLACGATDDDIAAAFERQLVPAASRFRPDIVLISAGFDSRAGDRLGCFAIGDDGFARLTRIVMKIADTHCAGRIVSVLEGGYQSAGLASAVLAHVDALTR
jgi:acetoin utilization deacetylase AcuC-like enzyme